MLALLDLPATLAAPSGPLTLRRARSCDLDAVMRLLADDPISVAAGDANNPDDEAAYARALARIQDDPSHELILAWRADRVTAMVHVSLMPGIAHRGALRLVIEGLRVAAVDRSAGVGGAMVRWIVEDVAPSLSAQLVQVASGTARTNAHRFYLRAGFQASHVGLTHTVREPSAPGSGAR